MQFMRLCKETRAGQWGLSQLPVLCEKLLNVSVLQENAMCLIAPS